MGEALGRAEPKSPPSSLRWPTGITERIWSLRDLKSYKLTFIESLEHELIVLLDWLCIEWGFCIPPDDYTRISRTSHWQSRDFALDILRAEGFPSPETELKWLRLIRRKFVEHFGADSVPLESTRI